MASTYLPDANVAWLCRSCDTRIWRFPYSPRPEALCPWCMSDKGWKKEGT